MKIKPVDTKVIFKRGLASSGTPPIINNYKPSTEPKPIPQNCKLNKLV